MNAISPIKSVRPWLARYSPGETRALEDHLIACCAPKPDAPSCIARTEEQHRALRDEVIETIKTDWLATSEIAQVLDQTKAAIGQKVGHMLRRGDIEKDESRPRKLRAVDGGAVYYAAIKKREEEQEERIAAAQRKNEAEREAFMTVLNALAVPLTVAELCMDTALPQREVRAALNSLMETAGVSRARSTHAYKYTRPADPSREQSQSTSDRLRDAIEDARA